MMQTNNAEYAECECKCARGAECAVGAKGREQSR